MRARLHRPLLVVATAGCALWGSGCGGPDAPDAPKEAAEPADRPVVHDPLSMPETPTLDLSAFDGAQSCGACHPDHLEQWSGSSHAYAMTDPVFQALVRLRQDQLESTEDQFCTQCHSAIGTRGGDCVPGFSFEDLSPITMEGVTCESCHRTVDVERPFNSGLRIDPAAPIAGVIEDPVDSPAHETRYFDALSSPRFCAGCHDVRETGGLPLERPYEEWLESPAAEEGPTCQACHMPTTEGPAATDGPTRELHSHRFVGVALPLLPGFLSPEQERALDADIDALLASAASLRLTLPAAVAAQAQLDVVVHVRNEIVGHALPTGTSFLRQLWLDVEVSDSTGDALYRTGDLDADGDLRDVWSVRDPFGDPDLIKLTSELIDAAGNPTPFPWAATDHPTSALPPLHERSYTLFVPVPADAQGPLTVTARLRFRSIAPWLLRLLDLTSLIDRLVIRDIASATGEVDLR